MGNLLDTVGDIGKTLYGLTGRGRRSQKEEEEKQVNLESFDRTVALEEVLKDNEKGSVLKEFVAGVRPLVAGGYMKSNEAISLVSKKGETLLKQQTQESKNISEVAKQGTLVEDLNKDGKIDNKDIALSVQKRKVEDLTLKAQVEGKPTTKLTKFMIDTKTGSVLETDTIREVPNSSPLPKFDPLEERRLAQEKRRNLTEFGATIDQDERKSFEDDMNIDIDTMSEQGRAVPRIGNDGKMRYRILSSKEFDTMVANKIIKPQELEHLNVINESKNALEEVVSGLEDIGIKDTSELGNAFSIDMEKVDNPNPLLADMGPFSLPAKFNLVGQYAKDPRYTSIKRKLERAFQQYRKVITGAQASDKELRMIRPLISSFSDRPQIFFSSINDIINENNRMIRDRLITMEASGRDVTKLKKIFKPSIGKKVNSMEQPSIDRAALIAAIKAKQGE
jgi:hypothetical protein